MALACPQRSVHLPPSEEAWRRSREAGLCLWAPPPPTPGAHPLERKARPRLGLRPHFAFCPAKSSVDSLSSGLEETPFPSLVTEDLSGWGRSWALKVAVAVAQGERCGLRILMQASQGGGGEGFPWAHALHVPVLPDAQGWHGLVLRAPRGYHYLLASPPVLSETSDVPCSVSATHCPPCPVAHLEALPLTRPLPPAVLVSVFQNRV